MFCLSFIQIASYLTIAQHSITNEMSFMNQCNNSCLHYRKRKCCSSGVLFSGHRNQV